MQGRAGQFGGRWRIVAAAAIGAAALTTADAGAATDRRLQIEAAAGAWDIVLEDSTRRCRITLRPEGTAGAHVLAMPAGCRRALPILVDAQGWRAEDQMRLALVARDGASLLDFAPDAQGRFLARGPEGEAYTITPADPTHRARMTQSAPPFMQQTPGFQTVQPRPVAPAAAAAPAAPVNPATLPGRYAVLREDGRDTGCMITLEDKAKGPKGSTKAFLAPACRDQGIVIFDPAGWHLDKGRLMLFARKGHFTLFDRQPDGAWLKDPKQGGKPLGLRRI
ncbi:MAG: AprI/Inh family metalloprotease inhibitor [Methylobacteriaceae bacterium]|nr:AprI/Inh family metalloprotease inhibitor [Methylobacteriaceae bacterium]